MKVGFGTIKHNDTDPPGLHFLKLFLRLDMSGMGTTCSGRIFQVETHRLEKDCLHASRSTRDTWILKRCPWVPVNASYVPRTRGEVEQRRQDPWQSLYQGTWVGHLYHHLIKQWVQHVHWISREAPGWLAHSENKPKQNMKSDIHSGGEESGQSGTKKNVLHTCVELNFVPWIMIFYLLYFLKTRKKCSLAHSKSMYANDVHGWGPPSCHKTIDQWALINWALWLKQSHQQYCVYVSNNCCRTLGTCWCLLYVSPFLHVKWPEQTPPPLVICNWFSKFCSQIGYLNLKLMLRWLFWWVGFFIVNVRQSSPFNAVFKSMRQYWRTSVFTLA